MLQQWKQQQQLNTTATSNSNNTTATSNRQQQQKQRCCRLSRSNFERCRRIRAYRASGNGQRKTNEGQLSQFKFNKLMYYVQEVTSRIWLAMIHISTWKQGGESVRQRGEEYIYIFGRGRGREMEYFKETAAIHKVKYLMWILITQNLNDEVHSSEYINLGSYRPAQRMELSIMSDPWRKHIHFNWFIIAEHVPWRDQRSRTLDQGSKTWYTLVPNI